MAKRPVFLFTVCVLSMTVAYGYLKAAGLRQQTIQTAEPSAVVSQRAVIDRYCVTCHNQRLKTAGLAIDGLNLNDIGTNAPVWEKVVRKLRAGLMPPAGNPRPERAASDDLAMWVEARLDESALRHPDPGRTEALHRLNRTEYHNVVRDLLALDVDVSELLPADDTSYGFDTIAGALNISPTLLERYLTAARKISRLAVGAPVPVTAETFRVKTDLPQEDRIEELPFGTRGGTVIHYNVPEDAEYSIQLAIGNRGAETHQVELTLDGERVKLFDVGRRAPGNVTVRVPMKAGPRTIGAAFIKMSDAEAEGIHQPYVRPYNGQTAQPRVDSVTITGPFKGVEPKSAGQMPSRRLIFQCVPANASEELPCATKILSALARRAYRRAVSDADVQVLLGFYTAGRADADFDSGIEAALRRLLVTPEFLFRIERDPAGIAANTSYRISDAELASRLSFFLWRSIPDDQLLDAALRGDLKKPDVLELQVRRMLQDPRATSLVTSFGEQWLLLRRVKDWDANGTLFPDFDESLRIALQRETELFLESIFREDRSVLELLTANYTFVNERLAKHYGIPNVYGPRFRRITLGDDSPRRGLLGQGSVLTLTSYAARTSPVIRGKWILENIVGAPPPPPPPNVNVALPDTKPGERPRTMRERMAAHRANPVCASCHSMLDPLGLSLENFDAVGRWRDSFEPGVPLDVSGVFPDGTKFVGPNGLRQALVGRPEQFVTNLTEKLLTYALGRGMEFYDGPAVRDIRRQSRAQNYSLSSIIVAIVKSTPFQMRRSLS